MHDEQTILRHSIAATLTIAGLGIGFGVVSGSFSIIFDGAYALIDAAMSLLALLVARRIALDTRRRRPDRRFQLGFWHFEPMVLALNGILLVTVSVYGFANGIGLILSGGRMLAFDWAIAYAAVTVAICAAMFVYERRANRRLGSDFVGLDARSWAMSGAITAALLVAFVVGRALEGSAHADLAPYVDPAVLALVCLVIAPIPLGTVRQAVSEILLIAPPELVARVENAARAVAQREGFPDFEAYVAKIGRSHQIELSFLVPAAFPIGDIRTLDAIRDEVGQAIGDEGPDRWLTIIFTGDEEWAR